MTNRKNRIGIALSLAILISIFFVLFSSDANKSALLRGDFPGFYVQAVIVASGKATELYNLDLQKNIQNEAWPDLDGSFLISVYPPSLALLLLPLGFLSAQQAQFIFTFLSCTCLFFSFNYLHSRSNFLKKSPWLLFALLISNPLLLVGTVGGQNTAYSIGILCLGMSLLESMKANGAKLLGLMSGLVFSCWLFKPQFGVFLLPGLLCFRLWYPLIGFTFGGLLHYLAGAILLGFIWPLEWVKKLIEFSSLNYAANGINQASIIGSLNTFFTTTINNSSEVSSLLSKLSLLAVILLTFAILVVLVRELKKRSESSIPVLFWIYLAAIPLIAPQTLFYDVGIIFFAALYCLCIPNKFKSEHITLFLFGIFQVFAWASILLRGSLPLSLFPIISLLYFAFSLNSVLKMRDLREKNPLVYESKCG